jgi:hypothetical protein
LPAAAGDVGGREGRLRQALFQRGALGCEFRQPPEKLLTGRSS